MVQNDLSDPMEIKNGVRQGDALACLLFNLALEKVVQGAWRPSNGFISSIPPLVICIMKVVTLRNRKKGLCTIVHEPHVLGPHYNCAIGGDCNTFKTLEVACTLKKSAHPCCRVTGSYINKEIKITEKDIENLH
ncbi:hypothetical protein TNCV_2605761 [Trichonephila clavipes]|nr:hypothetical protein TNCV_2605761 [Trichonephila clavipes]